MADSSSSSSDDGIPEEMLGRSSAHPSQQLPDTTAPADANLTTDGRPSPIRSMSSFRARLRQSRREPTAPVSLFQWETRGHFWSARDKAAAPKNSSKTHKGLSASVRRWSQVARVRLKNTATVIRLRPSVLLWPLLLGCCCLVAGLVGVHLGAQHEEQQNNDSALLAAARTLSAVSLSLSAALQPLRGLQLQVALTPQMAALGPVFPHLAEMMQKGAPPGLGGLFLAPGGVVRAVQSGAGSGAPQLGSSVAGAGTWEGVGPLAEQPILLLPDSSSVILRATQPVALPTLNINETWGNDPPTATTNGINGNCSSCPQLQAAGLGLWGFTGARLELGPAVGAEGGAVAGGDVLQALRAQGYLYRLSLLSSDAPGVLLAELLSSPPLSGGGTPVAAGAEAGEGVRAVWRLEVASEDGWEPVWVGPLTAVVVVVSLALSAALLVCLVLRQRHVMLLEAMLPRKVISVLSTGRSFYEHYDNVTILYADIVRYSNAPTNMHAWEVVKLLNDVNNIYDALLDKHGLIKIRRSGEAFMGVGGCPEAGDPVSAAVRVALCAREMVLATASYRSSAGQRVQIRLGLHSGPAVAAVLGTNMPRFSLLGDTIDIAHFMESTSNIMGVHVSDTTAELLAIADDPLIMLQPRGIIDIRGRGPITTSWLQMDLMGPMITHLTDSHLHKHTANRSASLNIPGNVENTNTTSGGGAAAIAATGDGRSGAAGAAASAATGSAAAAPADIACTADLAVAATLGVRGAPLVRKLSQTGLTQTRRALPDRRQREGRAGALYEHPLLGSFTSRLDDATMALVTELLHSSGPPLGDIIRGRAAVEVRPVVGCVEDGEEGVAGGSDGDGEVGGAGKVVGSGVGEVEDGGERGGSGGEEEPRRDVAVLVVEGRRGDGGKEGTGGQLKPAMPATADLEVDLG